MPVEAVQHIRLMCGGAQSHLMLGEDSNLYVVKFQNNVQGLRILANEWLAAGLARAVGLSVAECEIISVRPSLIAESPNLYVGYDGSQEQPRERCIPGLHFGSRYVGGLLPGLVVDMLDDQHLRNVSNLLEFAGILAFDTWTGNLDNRQVVFHKKTRDTAYKASFIDQGYCFGANSWTFRQHPLPANYLRPIVYQSITGWDSFEPWLGRIESLNPDNISSLAEGIPTQWHAQNKAALASLVEAVILRRGSVRDLIDYFRRGRDENSFTYPFPNWRSVPQYM